MNYNYSIEMTSIPEKAALLLDTTLSQVDEDTARTIFLVGSKNVGKSTLLHTFLDKGDTPRETIVLEYSFARKLSQKQAIDKTVCHIWEYGGKLETLKNTLLSVPVNGKFFYCIMIDLSKIKLIWNVIEVCIEAMHQTYAEPKTVPELIIVCGKYDLFKNYDNETKKFVCTTLRCLSIIHNAHLMFYTSKEPVLIKRAKDMFNNIAFGNCIPLKDKNTYYTKPLVIPSGTDSWESIGTSALTLHEVKDRHVSKIPPEPTLSDSFVSPTQKLAHPEAAIDTLAAMKYNELLNMESLDMSIYDYLLTINK